MKNSEFDERYPAIFQPGGDGLPRAAEVLTSPPVSLTPPTRAAAPTDRMAPREAIHPAVLNRAATPLTLPAAAAAAVPAEEPASNSKEAGPADQAPQPGTQEGAPGQGDRESHWSARSWIIGMSAVVLTLAGAAFCLFAAALIPTAASVAPDSLHGIMVRPWGQTIIPGASALLSAALGMVAAMLFLGARHYRSKTPWLRAGAAVVGLATLAGAGIALFSTELMPQIMYNSEYYQQTGANLIPWPTVIYSAIPQLMVLGLVIVAVVAIVRPGTSGPSGKAALLVGTVYVAGALLCMFAPQLFPLSLGTESRLLGELQYSTQPWPQIIVPAGGYLAVVGFGALLWGVLLLATSRPVGAQELQDDPEAYALQ